MLKRRLLRALGHRRSLRFGARDRVLRWFDDPDRTTAAEFVTPFFGGVYRGNFDTFVDWSTYYYGAYERDDLETIADLLSALPNTTFVDVGANVGHHALFAALLCGRVIAIEPFEPLVERLRQKMADNALSHVTIVTCGLGARDELAPYVPSSTNNSGTGRFTSGPGAVILPMRRGDDVLRDVGAEAPGFVKIDAEGLEPEVLAGLSRTLASARPLVWFEWSPRSATSRRDGRDLFPAGYEFFRRAPDRTRFGIFRAPETAMVRLQADWPEADILAAPREFHARVAADASRLRAAARLGPL